jgi:4'-phosphopantetheinyl transferase
LIEVRPDVHSVSIAAIEERFAAAGAASGVLSDRERDRWSALRVPKRRREWFSARVAAKELVSQRLSLRAPDALTSIEVRTEQDPPEEGRPYYALDAVRGRFDLSLAHAGDRALAALAGREGDRTGIDIELPAARDAGFESVALSTAEQTLVSGTRGPERTRLVTTIWTIKEAFLKAIGVGLRMPLQHVSVRDAAFWSRMPGGTSTMPLPDLLAVDSRSRRLHPLLERHESLRVSVFCFELDDLIGSSLTIIQPCSH